MARGGWYGRNPLKTGLVPASQNKRFHYLEHAVESQSPENGSRSCKTKEEPMLINLTPHVAIP